MENRKDRTDMNHAKLTDTENFASAAEIFRQLSDITRLRIFCLLCHREECVSAISELMQMNSPAVSHHLKQLRLSGLIVGRREGKEVYYKASDSDKAQTLHIATEKIMELCCVEDEPLTAAAQDYPDKAALAHSVHAYLLERIGERITIEELSRKFLVNPTTLKESFKAEYGNSLAAHIKEHRMEQAAHLLRHTSRTVSDIASAVGFSSQSRFSQAFCKAYGVLPVEYRKRSSESTASSCDE